MTIGYGLNHSLVLIFNLLYKTFQSYSLYSFQLLQRNAYLMKDEDSTYPYLGFIFLLLCF